MIMANDSERHDSELKSPPRAMVKPHNLMDFPGELHLGIIRQIINEYTLQLVEPRARHFQPTIISLGTVNHYWRNLCIPYLFERLAFHTLLNSIFQPPKAALAVCRTVDCSMVSWTMAARFERLPLELQSNSLSRFSAFVATLSRLNRVYLSDGAIEMGVQDHIPRNIEHVVWKGCYDLDLLFREQPFRSLHFEDCVPPSGNFNVEHLVLDDCLPMNVGLVEKDSTVKALELRRCDLAPESLQLTLHLFGKFLTSLVIWTCELSGEFQTVPPSALPNLQHLTLRYLDCSAVDLLLDYFAPCSTIQTLATQALMHGATVPDDVWEMAFPQATQLERVLEDGGMLGLKKLEVRFDSMSAGWRTSEGMPTPDDDLQSLGQACRARGIQYELKGWRDGVIEITEADLL